MRLVQFPANNNPVYTRIKWYCLYLVGAFLPMKYAVLLIIFITGCGEKQSVCRYSRHRLMSQMDKVFITSVKDGKPVHFRDKGYDSITAGYYEFYPNEQLKSYTFFVSRDTATYEEKYDENGNFLSSFSDPLIGKTASTTKEDSVIVGILLFALNKTFDVTAVINGKAYNNVLLRKDSIYSNATSATITIGPFNKETRISGVWIVNYTQTCVDKISTFREKVSLRYLPYK